MRDAKILVVEDDDDIRDTLKELLEEEGYQVDTAANGEQALRRLRSEAPQIILLDLMMPVMDGWEFQKQLRQIPSFARVPIIVISASKFSREPLNAAAFIPKPLDAGVLLEMIESFLGESSPELEAR